MFAFLSWAQRRRLRLLQRRRRPRRRRRRARLQLGLEQGTELNSSFATSRSKRRKRTFASCSARTPPSSPFACPRALAARVVGSPLWSLSPLATPRRRSPPSPARTCTVDTWSWSGRRRAPPPLLLRQGGSEIVALCCIVKVKKMRIRKCRFKNLRKRTRRLSIQTPTPTPADAASYRPNRSRVPNKQTKRQTPTSKARQKSRA